MEMRESLESFSKNILSFFYIFCNDVAVLEHILVKYNMLI